MPISFTYFSTRLTSKTNLKKNACISVKERDEWVKAYRVEVQVHPVGTQGHNTFVWEKLTKSIKSVVSFFLFLAMTESLLFFFFFIGIFWLVPPLKRSFSRSAESARLVPSVLPAHCQTLPDPSSCREVVVNLITEQNLVKQSYPSFLLKKKKKLILCEHLQRPGIKHHYVNLLLPIYNVFRFFFSNNFSPFLSATRHVSQPWGKRKDQLINYLIMECCNPEITLMHSSHFCQL